jgi:hypothetical protein
MGSIVGPNPRKAEAASRNNWYGFLPHDER